MKFPSILRVPDHKKFRLQNRHYDPIKEDIENRTALIKADMDRRNNENSDVTDYQSKIVGSFRQKALYQESKSGMLRFLLMVSLFFGAIGYMYLGNVVLYIFLGVLVLIYFLRKRRII